MTRKRTRAAAAADTPDIAFDPARLRARHDGWTPERQTGFIDALAASGCVEHACRHVGLSRASAYALRARAEAQGFRQAWDVALDYAVDRLADAALSRAIHGVAHPVFYQGEQIGERRRYDERLAMFVLRYRRPERYGAWLDTCEARRDPETPAVQFVRARARAEDDAWAEAGGHPRWPHPPLTRVVHTSHEEEARRAERRAEAVERALQARYDAALDAFIAGAGPDPGARDAFEIPIFGRDVASSSPTSGRRFSP